jgi:hypothetical protein
MTEISDEPIEEATACGSSNSGQLASSASWPNDDDTDDDYEKLLASMGRTEDQDRRIAVRELSHFLVNRLLAIYEGLCRGARRAAFTKAGVIGADAADIRKVLQPMMPEPGQDVLPRQTFSKAFSTPSRN